MLEVEKTPKILVRREEGVECVGNVKNSQVQDTNGSESGERSVR
jgi:hypothetical protein